MRPLTENELEMITKATLISTAEKGLENARKNKHLVKKSILDIQDKHEEKGALLISAGPSLKRIDPAVIKDSGFKGSIVSVDASLPFCLKNGIIPDCVVSVDEDPVRIIRWYGDPEFENRKYDDYFTKKYGGSKTFEDEVRANKEYIELVNKHAPKIKAIIATSVTTMLQSAAQKPALIRTGGIQCTMIMKRKTASLDKHIKLSRCRR